MTVPLNSEETPCYSRTADSVNNGTGKITLIEYRRQSTVDLSKRSVRTSSVEEFLNGLLPFRPGRDSRLQRPMLTTNPFKKLKNADSLVEAEVVELFVTAVNSHGLIPGLVMARCEHRADPKNIDETGQKIDAAFFPALSAPSDECPHWPDQTGSAEFKSGKTGDARDPWSDVEGNPEPESEERSKNRGQAMTFAELVCAMQQRVFLFMLYVVGRRFRLLRWDRAGVIFSPLVDYFENPEPLLEFLWRLSHLGDTALGLDPSTTRLSHQGRDWKTMDRVAQDARYDFDHEERDLDADEEVPEKFTWKYVREMFAESISNPEWPRFKLHVNVAPKTTRAFLVGKPVVRADGLVGPGTRWYVAFDCEERRFVWLKDYWRASYELVETEGDILASFNAAGVENVPTLVCHGDVRKQVTLTAQWWEAQHPINPEPAQAPPRRRRVRLVAPGEENEEIVPQPDGQNPVTVGYRKDCPIRQLTHYRIVTEEVCMPLVEFEDGLQLVSIVLDCLNAHRDAMEKPSEGRLHRNITDRSTLIYAKVLTHDDGARTIEWRGILADWELSKAGAGPERSIARQPERNGSWQFMSANLLSLTPARFSIADDLESLVLVLIYYAARYLTSSIQDGHLVALFLEQCFDCYTIGDGKILCGERKLDIMKDDRGVVYCLPGKGRTRVFFESPLDGLLNTVLGWFRFHYKVLDWEAEVVRNPSLARAQEHFQTPAKSSRRDAGNGGPHHRNDVDNPGGSKLPPAPTSEERSIGLRVSAHSFIIDEFSGALEADWTEGSRHPDGDRVPKGWMSTLDPVPQCYISSESA